MKALNSKVAFTGRDGLVKPPLVGQLGGLVQQRWLVDCDKGIAASPFDRIRRSGARRHQ